jgi:ASC-1-like (ASCH) protein
MKINHELKILPCYFKAVRNGEKTFETRDNQDRWFKKGDIIKLNEYDERYGYSGRSRHVRITYIADAYQKEGYVVFAFKMISAD